MCSWSVGDGYDESRSVARRLWTDKHVHGRISRLESDILLITGELIELNVNKDLCCMQKHDTRPWTIPTGAGKQTTNQPPCGP